MPERGAPSDIRTYRDLVAWQKGMALAELVYRATAALPPEEKFGLVSQMRRAAVSIPANIAEGFGRAGKVEFRRYLEISRGQPL
jgi:four helix bundle protein